MSSDFIFHSDWIEASLLEDVLGAGHGPHGARTPDVRFIFPTGCKVMIDAAVKLLSLFNQLDHCCRRVTLEFEEGEFGTMGYLNRMGFFDSLSQNIDVLPQRPAYSGAELYGGTSANLVEIARINRQHQDQSLPSRLTNALMQSCGNRPDEKKLELAAWTIFTELIGNIFSHSETPLDGY